MKRFLAVFSLVALAVATCIAGVAQAGPYFVTKQLVWRTSAANAAGYVDSTIASINGAVQTVDTTVAISTDDWDWTEVGQVPSTAHGAFKVMFVSTGGVSTDSIFVAVESSPDGRNWATNATFIGMVGTSGDEVIGGVVTSKSDTQSSTGAGSVWAWPYLRLRVRADGNTGALFPNAQVYIRYAKNINAF